LTNKKQNRAGFLGVASVLQTLSIGLFLAVAMMTASRETCGAQTWKGQTAHDATLSHTLKPYMTFTASNENFSVCTLRARLLLDDVSIFLDYDGLSFLGVAS
jgi:hypothetical protein